MNLLTFRPSPLYSIGTNLRKILLLMAVPATDFGGWKAEAEGALYPSEEERYTSEFGEVVMRRKQVVQFTRRLVLSGAVFLVAVRVCQAQTPQEAPEKSSTSADARMVQELASQVKELRAVMARMQAQMDRMQAETVKLKNELRPSTARAAVSDSPSLASLTPAADLENAVSQTEDSKGEDTGSQNQ